MKYSTILTIFIFISIFHSHTLSADNLIDTYTKIIFVKDFIKDNSVYIPIPNEAKYQDFEGQTMYLHYINGSVRQTRINNMTTWTGHDMEGLVTKTYAVYHAYLDYGKPLFISPTKIHFTASNYYSEVIEKNELLLNKAASHIKTHSKLTKVPSDKHCGQQLKLLTNNQKQYYFYKAECLDQKTKSRSEISYNSLLIMGNINLSLLYEHYDFITEYGNEPRHELAGPGLDLDNDNNIEIFITGYDRLNSSTDIIEINAGISTKISDISSNSEGTPYYPLDRYMSLLTNSPHVSDEN